MTTGLRRPYVGRVGDRIEGCLPMRLVIRVPEVLAVEARKGLSGPNSARQPSDVFLPPPWQEGPVSPGPGWAAIPAVADPNSR